MSRSSNSDDPADAEAMRRHAAALADAMVAAIPRWVERLVVDRALAAGVDPEVAAGEASRAADAAIGDAEARIRELLDADIDDQTTTPLAVLRSLVSYPNDALDRLGVPPHPRAGFERDAFPDDHHGLTPAAFSDVDPGLHEPGIIWGAAKAHIHLRRHRI